ncbi:MAG: site-specific integrase [Burkholderiales bacterium]|nr:site-specific integrase [Burkholderiales bacterium]
MNPATAVPAAPVAANCGVAADVPASTPAGGIAERLRALAERPQAMTVRALIGRYMAVYAGRDHTRSQRLAAWDQLLGDFTLERLDSDVLYAARAELKAQPALAFKGRDHEGRRIFRTRPGARPKTPATLNRYMGAIAAVFTWGIEQRLSPRGWVNPCRGIRRLPGEHERVRWLEAEDRERLFAACRASRYPRLFALVLTAMLTGARKGELLSLRWRDVDLAGGVARLGRTKNGDRRTLVLLPQVVDVLRPFVGAPDRFVFGSTRAKYQAPAVVDSAFADALKRARLKDFKFHDLRHCCASLMVQAGADLHVVAEVLGHRTLTTTRRYAHLKTQTKAQAMAAALGEIK